MLTLFSVVFAQPATPTPQTIRVAPTGQWAGLSNFSFGAVVSALITLILVVAAIVFVFMLLWGGFKYISSGGDKGQLESSRGTITAALIGLTILFATWAIINLVSTFFGVDLININLPSALP